MALFKVIDTQGYHIAKELYILRYTIRESNNIKIKFDVLGSNCLQNFS